MEETFKRELDRAARRNMPIGVIMFDIDYFKLFNDNFGHAAGDAVLSEMGYFVEHMSAVRISLAGMEAMNSL